MSVNDNLSRGEIITMAVPLAANSGVGPLSGDLLIFGTNGSPSYNLVGVAMENYTPTAARTATGNISVKFIGVALLSVVGKSSIAPGTGKAIAPGDPVFADGGTYDATTGCTYGCTLNANTVRGYLVGYALDAVLSGATSTIRVKLQGGA